MDSLPASASGPVQPLRNVRRLNPFGNALVLTVMAAAIGAIELVGFSLVASHYNVPLAPSQMPEIWRVAYQLLYLIPGVLLLGAALYVLSLFKD